MRPQIRQAVRDRLQKKLKRGDFDRLWRHLVRLSDRLADDPYVGDFIPQRRRPAAFREGPNLWRVALPGGWRALYTTATHPGRGVDVRVVWVGDHTDYDRLFGYR